MFNFLKKFNIPPTDKKKDAHEEIISPIESNEGEDQFSLEVIEGKISELLAHTGKKLEKLNNFSEEQLTRLGELAKYGTIAAVMMASLNTEASPVKKKNYRWVTKKEAARIETAKQARQQDYQAQFNKTPAQIEAERKQQEQTQREKAAKRQRDWQISQQVIGGLIGGVQQGVRTADPFIQDQQTREQMRQVNQGINQGGSILNQIFQIGQQVERAKQNK